MGQIEFCAYLARKKGPEKNYYNSSNLVFVNCSNWFTLYSDFYTYSTPKNSCQSKKYGEVIKQWVRYSKIKANGEKIKCVKIF
jgi:hypothetical protein